MGVVAPQKMPPETLRGAAAVSRSTSSLGPPYPPTRNPRRLRNPARATFLGPAAFLRHAAKSDVGGFGGHNQACSWNGGRRPPKNAARNAAGGGSRFPPTSLLGPPYPPTRNPRRLRNPARVAFLGPAAGTQPNLTSGGLGGTIRRAAGMGSSPPKKCRQRRCGGRQPFPALLPRSAPRTPQPEVRAASETRPAPPFSDTPGTQPDSDVGGFGGHNQACSWKGVVAPQKMPPETLRGAAAVSRSTSSLGPPYPPTRNPRRLRNPARVAFLGHAGTRQSDVGGFGGHNQACSWNGVVAPQKMPPETLRGAAAVSRATSSLGPPYPPTRNPRRLRNPARAAFLGHAGHAARSDVGGFGGHNQACRWKGVVAPQKMPPETLRGAAAVSRSTSSLGPPYPPTRNPRRLRNPARTAFLGHAGHAARSDVGGFGGHNQACSWKGVVAPQKMPPETLRGAAAVSRSTSSLGPPYPPTRNPRRLRNPARAAFLGHAGHAARFDVGGFGGHNQACRWKGVVAPQKMPPETLRGAAAVSRSTSSLGPPYPPTPKSAPPPKPGPRRLSRTRRARSQI